MTRINIDIATAKTSELLAFYNDHAEKPVNKFTNLDTARRRVTALVESLKVSARAHRAAEAAAQAAQAAQAAARNANKIAKTVDKTIKHADPAPEKKAGKAQEPAATAPQARRSNAAGIAASWNDPDVREARLFRQGVVVQVGKKSAEFNSTHAAFEALGLPMSKVIRFRMKLKEAKKLTFEHAGKSYEFTIL